VARPNPLNEVLLPPWTSGIYSKASTSRAFGLKGKQTNYTHMTYEKKYVCHNTFNVQIRIRAIPDCSSDCTILLIPVDPILLNPTFMEWFSQD